jgi:hypothetical protein
MIISRHKGRYIAVDLVAGSIHPFSLVKRVSPSGSKAASPTEHKIRKQALEITEKIDRERPPGVATRRAFDYRYSSVSKIFESLYQNNSSNINNL